MLLAALLSVVVGLALGLLGGGGSILTVPILLYSAKLEPGNAIATSLLVVFVTSLAATIPHARAGNVRWKTAFVFGGAGLFGAFAGGRTAALVPQTWLLTGFAVLMFVTAVAMIRGRSPSTPPVAEHRPYIGRLAIEGVLVGFATGLVGAGGGFVVVPALVMFGGMPMCAAIGTSLVVISMNSFAGFIGHWSHAEIPWALALAVALPAVTASVLAARLAKRVPDSWFRPLFGWSVLMMAIYVGGQQVPGSLRLDRVFQALFVQRWPWWAGGTAVGALVLGLLWYDNKLLGVSTGCVELCKLRADRSLRGSWRLLFLLGIVAGGFVSSALQGTHTTWAHGGFDQLISGRLLIKVPVLFIGGALVGYGARAAGGCTSGHGIVGMAQGARSSITATAAFMAGGFATTTLLFILGR